MSNAFVTKLIYKSVEILFCRPCESRKKNLATKEKFSVIQFRCIELKKNSSLSTKHQYNINQFNFNRLRESTYLWTKL